MTSLILYSRIYCHLCDDMQAALAPFKAQFDFDLKVIDVDADPHLVTLYDDLVPVLAIATASGEIREVCHYFLDTGALHALLSSQGVQVQNHGLA